MHRNFVGSLWCDTKIDQKKTIAKYQIANAKSRSSFDNWIDKLSNSNWNTTNDIKQTYGSADVLGK